MTVVEKENIFDFLKSKSNWVRKETLKIHKIAQDTRIASSSGSIQRI